MAFDPTEVASNQEAQQRIVAAGAPTEFAKGPGQDGVQVAGVGKLFDLLNMLDSGVVPPKPPKVKAATAGQARMLTPEQLAAVPEVDPTALSGMLAPRMPTPQEVGLVPDSGAFSETATKRALAGQVLSPEGVARFEAQGLKAPKIGEETPTDVIQDAQSAFADEAAEAEASAVDINDLAKKAMQADAKGFNAETALVSEEVADEILTRVQVKDQNIVSLQDGGDFNFDYVDTTDDVKAMITAVGERYKDETAARTRGKIPNDLTIQNAEKIFLDEIGFTRELLNRQIGEGALNAEEFLAAREILVKSADTLTKLAEQIKSGTAGADARLRFRRQLSIHSGIQLQLKGAQTEAARALQSFQIRVDGELDAKAFGEEAQRLLSETGANQSTDALAAALLSSAKENGLAGINRVAEVGKYAKTKNAVHQAYLAGLLSSPATQMKNIIGTTSFMLFQLPTEVMAGMYGSIARGIKKPFGQVHAPISEDQAYIEDALLRVKGWSDAYRDALKAGSIAWRTEMPAGATKLDIERYSPSVSSGDSFFGRSIDEVGKRMRIPFRLLLAADEFTKTISQRGEFYTQINRRYQHSLRKGMGEQEALDEAGMMLLDPSSVADDLVAQSKFDTLQSDLGAFGDVTGKLQRTLLGRFIMPFVTAPTNAVLRTMEYVPGMPSKSIADLTGKNGNRARQLALGRYTMGGAVMFQTAQFAMDGKITGSMPNDKASRSALPPGWQPYSFVLKGEGFPEGMSLYDSFGAPNGPLRYVSFAGFEPVGGLLAITADTVQRANKTSDPELRENYAQAALLSTMDYYKELPMLQGISDVVSFLDGYDAAKLSRSYAESATIAGFPNPVSSLQRMFQRLADPTRVRPREDFEYYTLEEVEAISVDADGKKTFAFPLPDGTPNYAIVGSQKGGTTEALMEYFQEMNALQSKDSFIRDERDLNAVVYDTFGNAKGSDEFSFAVNPVAAVFSNVSGFRLKKGEKLEPYEKELIRLQAMTNKWPLTNPETMGQIKLSYGMQSDLINLAKNEIELSLDGYGPLDFRNALAVFTSTREYQEMEDSVKLNFLRGLNSKFIKAGEEALIESPRYANMRKAYQQVEQLKAEGLR